MVAVSPDTLRLIELALLEDAADHDLTAQATIAADSHGEAMIRAKADGVLSGTKIARAVFQRMDATLEQQWLKDDASLVRPGDIIARLQGPLRPLLAAERTALNFMQHLSGIATATRRFVDAVRGTPCRIVDTRKTTPAFRALEKQAVVHGGGINHRMDLASGMLIKENHIEGCGSISRAIATCRKQAKVWVEVECETLDEVAEAVRAGPNIILLDNMKPQQVRQAREMVPATIVLEASGNITLDNVREYAATGVDRVAIGGITHSAPALDLSMRICRA